MDQHQPHLKRLAANSLYSGISEGTVVLLFLLFILAARILGDAQFGVFSFALAFVNIFGIMTEFGLRYVYVREVSRDKNLAERYLGNILVIQIGLSLAAIVSIFAAINLLDKPQETRTVVYLLGGAEILRSAKFLFRFSFRAMDQFSLESLTVALERVLLLVVGIAVLAAGWGVTALALIFLVVRIFDFLVAVLLSARKSVRPTLRMDLALWPYLFKKAAPFALSGVVLLVFFRVSTVLLSLIRTDAEVGWYSASYKLIEGMVVFPAVFSASLLPSISRFHKDRETVIALFSRGVKYVLLAAIPLTIIGYVLSEQVILVVFGAEYTNSIPVLRWILFGLSFMFIHEIGGSVLAGLDRQKESFLIAAFILVINVILNLFLIPRYGHLGAAGATMASETLFGLLSAGYLAYKGIRVAYISIASKPVLAALIVAGVIYFFIPSLWIAAPVAVIGYFGLLTIFSFWDAEEMALFKRFLSRALRWIKGAHAQFLRRMGHQVNR